MLNLKHGLKMKRRDFFKRVISTCLVLVPGAKVAESKNTRIKYFPPVDYEGPVITQQDLAAGRKLVMQFKNGRILF